MVGVWGLVELAWETQAGNGNRPNYNTEVTAYVNLIGRSTADVHNYRKYATNLANVAFAKFRSYPLLIQISHSYM